MSYVTTIFSFSANAVYCSGVGFGPSDSDWLMWLCIAFGILFGVMLLINIFLCSAMTCSCTRSEIIEKEPSVYDDYSIYDSQYGKKTSSIYFTCQQPIINSDFFFSWLFFKQNLKPLTNHEKIGRFRMWLWRTRLISRSAHTNNQYESRISTTNFLLIHFLSIFTR